MILTAARRRKRLPERPLDRRCERAENLPHSACCFHFGLPSFHVIGSIYDASVHRQRGS